MLQSQRWQTRRSQVNNKQEKMEIISSMKSTTAPHLASMLLLLLAPRSFLFHLRSLWAAPPLAPVLRLLIDYADVPISPHRLYFLLLFPRVRPLSPQPLASKRPEKSRQGVLPVRVPPRCSCFHFPHGPCWPTNSVTLPLPLYIAIVRVRNIRTQLWGSPLRNLLLRCLLLLFWRQRLRRRQGLRW